MDAVTDALLEDLTEDALHAVDRTRQQQRLRPSPPHAAPITAEQKETPPVQSSPSTPPRRPPIPRLPLTLSPSYRVDHKESEEESSGGTVTPKKESLASRVTPSEDDAAALLSSLVSSWLNDSVGEWMSLQRAAQQRLQAQSEARLSPVSPSTPPPGTSGRGGHSPQSPPSAADEYTREFGLVEDKGILDVSVNSDASETLSDDSLTTSWRVEATKRPHGLHTAEYVDSLLKEAEAVLTLDPTRTWKAEELLQAVQRGRKGRADVSSPALVLHDGEQVAFHHFILDLLLHHHTTRAVTRDRQPWQRPRLTPPSTLITHPLLTQALGAVGAGAGGWGGLSTLPLNNATGPSALIPLVHVVAEQVKWTERQSEEWKEGTERAQAALIASLADDITRSLLDDLTQQLTALDSHRPS